MKTGECLKQIGSSILLTSFVNICAFLAAAIIPIPALRCFALQAAILIAFISISVILLFPAIASLDLRERWGSHKTKLCCRYSTVPNNAGHPSDDSSKLQQKMFFKKKVNSKKCVDGSHVVTILAPDTSAQPFLNKTDKVCRCAHNDSQVREQCAPGATRVRSDCVRYQHLSAVRTCSLTHFANHIYAPFLQKKSVKVLVVFVFLVMVTFGIIGMVRVDDGLDLTDIVPRNTIEHRFLNYQRKYFSFFNMFAVTQGNFDYPNNQKLLHEYHQAFTRVGQIIKNDDGGLPEFWLTMFRDWLVGLQEAFDNDWKKGCITRENWFTNASDEGILAYKLLVQTGRVDNPVDKSLVRIVFITGVQKGVDVNNNLQPHGVKVAFSNQIWAPLNLS